MRITQGLFIIGNGIEAHYDYAPFGAITRAISASAVSDNTFTTENPFRFPSPGGLGRIFSSEYLDDTLGLEYYNYRHYNPIDGRWINRDPIEKVGVYVQDSYDFQDAQNLGYWDAKTNYAGKNPFKGDWVTNGDFRNYAKMNNKGHDFLIHSNMKITTLNQSERIVVKE